ncbi:MAG TPA: heat-inducible transcriptional repressor HrcA [Actinomycetota bacterium]|nr:heat-inducible transcriptional repressor HrcA [Actinomycetota bacterium]
MAGTERGELGPRKQAVLRAVVEEYVRTGEPVGSETVSERGNLGVSSATIRNEMAALEELGYLSHPHTSAGRAPTDMGYRNYVDMLPPGRLREAQRRAIADFFRQTAVDMEEVLVGATRLLSTLTQYAGLAAPRSPTEDRIARAELIEIGPSLMILLVGEHGRVYKAFADRPGDATADAARDASSRVASLTGLSLTEAAERARAMRMDAAPDQRDLMGLVAQALDGVRLRSEEEHVLVGGVGNLAAEVVTWRLDTVRRLLEAIERESEMLTLLKRASAADDLSVTIGGEHPSTGEWDAAIVAAPYRAGETPVGSIGIVGPTRMDYLTAMTTVRAVARRLSELATQLDPPQ